LKTKAIVLAIPVRKLLEAALSCKLSLKLRMLCSFLRNLTLICTKYIQQI